jgi:hypothetical protein
MALKNRATLDNHSFSAFSADMRYRLWDWFSPAKAPLMLSSVIFLIVNLIFWYSIMNSDKKHKEIRV